MTGEAEPPAEAEYQPPFCSSPACRILSSVGFIGSGLWVYFGIRDSRAGQMWRFQRKVPHLQLFLSMGLMCWGLTILLVRPRTWKN